MTSIYCASSSRVTYSRFTNTNATTVSGAANNKPAKPNKVLAANNENNSNAGKAYGTLLYQWL
ncbi:hypothetical protein HSBAA_55350 [Vreelandella sulfidaeris]|uniref:Uncharacterized protein n=1 Tax=Vreelandella sulfidaeris TaxID=115553 RepID=A0A455UJ22_9GAMM|nr:hypothetical protein HSBAA_55350 [Halomonas sulfidaeris]